MVWLRVAGFFAALMGLLGAAPAAAQSRLMNVTTGGVQGVYYAAGGAICRLVNRDRATSGIRCINLVSQGSAANVDSLARSAANIAIVQSDVQLQVAQGLAPFDRSGLKDEMRSMFALHTELLTIMSSADAGASDLAGLKAKRVSRGNPGSGSRTAADFTLAQAGWSATDGAVDVERAADEQSYALCEKKLDAMFMVVGHPAAVVTRTTKDCASKLIGLDDALQQRLVSNNPAWVRGVIPAGTYANQSAAVASVGPVATVVTTASTPEALVYAAVKAVFDNLEEFKALYPAASQLDPKRMIKEGLAAPLHPGAQRYFKERGWL